MSEGFPGAPRAGPLGAWRRRRRRLGPAPWPRPFGAARRDRRHRVQGRALGEKRASRSSRRADMQCRHDGGGPLNVTRKARIGREPSPD